MSNTATAFWPPGPTDEMSTGEQFMPFRFSALASRMTRATARVYAQRYDLSAPEWRILALLGRTGALTANAVVERTAIDKVRASRTVTRLLTRGHIVRTTDPNDRRRAILELTPTGEEIYREIAPRMQAVEAELFRSLSTDERAALAKLISQLEQKVAGMVSGEPA